MSSEIRQFWMVKGRGPSTACHDSRDMAEAEAERLACENPGQAFFVMEAVTAHRKISVERISLRDDDQYIPTYIRCSF